MKLIELCDQIFQGKHIERNELSTSPNDTLYLQPKNLVNNLITEESAFYLNKSIAKKITKNETLSYGDILVYHKSDNDFGFFRFMQDFNKTIVPSPHFAVIKTNSNFLTNIIQQESARSYLKGEIQEVWKHKEGNWKLLVSELRNIEVPLSFEQDQISVSPGNIPVNKEDFASISIRKGIISADNLIKRVNNKEIHIDGYFQRKAKLWDIGTKSRLIETLILDIPIPPLYFDIVTKSEWLIIDGLQRISTIVDFFNDVFELAELDFLPELNGKKFSQLERVTQRSVEEAELATFSIQPGTPRTVRYKIFKNINTSALILNRQEIRHAMNDDERKKEFTPSLYMAQTAEILNKYIKIPQSDIDRMYDREYALRYVTFRMFFYKLDYKPNMADFLDKAVENMYSYPKNKLEIYKEEFENILKILTNIFEPDVLFTRRMITSKEEEGETRNVINGALLETWTYAVAQLSAENKKLIISKAKEVKEKSQALSTDTTFLRSIDNRFSNSIEMVKTRFATITNLINDSLNDK